MRKIVACDKVYLNHPPQKVWSIISDFNSYSKWWPWFVKIQINNFSESIIGTVIKVKVFGGKSFFSKVENIKNEEQIKLLYFDGLYYGYGIWKIDGQGNSSILSYEVDLEIKDPFIRILSYIVSISKLHSLTFKHIFRNLGKYIGRIKEDVIRI